jgi:hypothetical protein
MQQGAGLARSTIGRGLKDRDAPPLRQGRVRREGGGPRSRTDRDPTLLTALEHLVAPATRGDPERPLLWVSKSLDKMACALTDMGHAISPNSVRKLLIGLGFSRQSNRKADEGIRSVGSGFDSSRDVFVVFRIGQRYPCARRKQWSSKAWGDSA